MNENEYKTYEMTEDDIRALDNICKSELTDWEKMGNGTYEYDTGIAVMSRVIFAPYFIYLAGEAYTTSSSSKNIHNWTLIVDEECFKSVITPLLTEGKVVVKSRDSEDEMISITAPNMNEIQQTKIRNSSLPGFNRLFRGNTVNFRECQIKCVNSR